MATTPGTRADPTAAPHAVREGLSGPGVDIPAEADALARPRSKTGLTGTGALAKPTPVPPTDGSLSSGGLHAKAMTPGPVVQQFVTLGRYQLLSRLAVGGMAEVYLARQGELSGFKTLVVVKKVLPHLAVKPDFIAMFLDEARIASMLDHPNVVRILEVGRTDSEFFLAMELVQGKALAAILQQSERAKTPLPHPLGALIVANAAAGLHHAHQLTDTNGALLGLVHRDISPQNIMVSFEGSVKVIDFGIARALGRLGDTNSGSLKGKLGYMAPEQARGEPVDARADIFSLGVVLWECVAGRRLFLRENELATLRAVVYEPIPKVSKYTKVDPVLEVIIEHAVARDLEERFQTAEEMRVALERWVFAGGGASTHDLAGLMKSWFPSDHQQWQRAARMALDIQESDPPIDLTFPDLASSKSAGSRTGSGRSSSSSAARQAALAMGSQISSQIVPLPSLPVPLPEPKRRSGFWLFFLFLLLLGGGATAAYFFYWKPAETSPDVAAQPAAQPVRPPKVEILPVGQAPSPPSPASTKPSEPTAPTPTPAQAEPVQDGTDDSATTGKRRRHSFHRRDDTTEDKPTKRPNPFDKPGGKKPTELRPNPF
jgi:eukaryotic-like serine/threonine-protein kinase